LFESLFLLSFHSPLSFGYVILVLFLWTLPLSWVAVPVSVVTLKIICVTVHYVYCHSWTFLYMWLGTDVSFPTCWYWVFPCNSLCWKIILFRYILGHSPVFYSTIVVVWFTSF
jgi:hypothetical protein